MFLIYLTFLPTNAGWAISLLWGMMILPLGDALQNTMQNLVSRIAGENNEELANRGIGMGAAMGHTVKSIAYQFKGNNDETKTGGNSIISKVINKANHIESKEASGTSYERYSKNIMEDKNTNSITNITNTNSTENKTMNNNTVNNRMQNASKDINNVSGVKKAFNVGKEFMNLGMYMAEGRNFKTNNENNIQKRMYDRPNINNTRQEDKKEEKSKIITMEVDDEND